MGPIPGLNALMATLPPLPHGAPVAAANPIGGAPSPNLWQFGDRTDAKAVAVAVRTAYANPNGGGGAGPAMRVCQFSTNAPFVWW